jgi:hypothetical protein
MVGRFIGVTCHISVGHGTSLGKDKFRRGVLDRSPPRSAMMGRSQLHEALRLNERHVGHQTHRPLRVFSQVALEIGRKDLFFIYTE